MLRFLVDKEGGGLGEGAGIFCKGLNFLKFVVT